MSVYRGRLIRWNDEKGFGFVESNIEKNGIFLHISALKGMSRRPVVNDVITYELLSENKKIRAINATIEGVDAIRTRPKINIKKKVKRSQLDKLKSLLPVIFVLSILFITYRSLSYYRNFRNFGSQNVVDYKDVNDASVIPQKTISHNETNNAKFTCDGRTHCSQMVSKEEAIYFITHCPNTKMDGDGDGEPCEDQFGRN
ncbi:MAG: hypothetical protein QG651_928 [Pseudomonadota bacterium]|jgi:cold shock CspA family protein|nr:hypothetical protein [Pseudomonadota bacterium]